ncbi:MAG: GNAT family N-acetyltransferase, partial [Thermus caldifontis]
MGRMRTLNLSLRPVLPADAPLLHQLFLRSPGYFASIGMEPPALEDVARDLATLEKDHRRRAFLLFLKEEVVGYLDYKLHYPEPEDATL